jgi:hypothetical protein
VRSANGELCPRLFPASLSGIIVRARELARILDRVVEIGLRGGWAELQDTPLQIPRIQLNIPARDTRTQSEPETPKLDSQ